LVVLQEPRVPEFVKSELPTPLTAVSKVTVNVNSDAFVFVVEDENVGRRGSKVSPHLANPELPPWLM